MDYFTSDLHFCHDRNFIWGKRGFQSVQEMNEAIVKNFNEIITSNDNLYILGDLLLNNDIQGIKFLNRLNGIKYIIWGNHDTENRQKAIAETVPSCIILGYGSTYKYKGNSFYLSHYPTLTGNYNDKHPVWNLSGHTHLSEVFPSESNLIYNVALDAHDMKPVSIEQIIEDIKRYKK